MIEPNYLPFILIGGGIIFVVLFFHYVHFSSGCLPKFRGYASHWCNYS